MIGPVTLPPVDAEAMARTRHRLNQLTKPRDSLGELERLAVRLAGMTGQEAPAFARKAVIVMAADHGVSARGVSAYPPEVTAQMVANFLAGGAAVNALARQAHADVIVVDVGCFRRCTAGHGPAPGGPAGGPQAGSAANAFAASWEPGPSPRVRFSERRVRAGTEDMTQGPAMTREQAEQAWRAGAETVDELAREGVQLIALGDMGISNTTAASAVTAALTGLPPVDVTGRGTGLDPAGLARKIRTVEQALQVNDPDPQDALDVLGKVGGLELAALAGAAVAAAARRIPVVLDGFTVGAAALAATRVAPDLPHYLIAGHQSAEPGHGPVLRALGLRPLLHLDMRLGEASGAVLAFHLIDAATRVLTEMATFESAGVAQSAKG